MAWDRAKIGSGEVWRLITGHLVHSNSNHILLNSIGIAVVLLLIGDRFSTRTLCSLSVFIAFLTSLLLYVFEPQLSYYVGFSAALHGLVASYSITALRKTPRYACLILCLLGLKLAFEGQPQFTANLIDIRVALVGLCQRHHCGRYLHGHVTKAKNHHRNGAGLKRRLSPQKHIR